jgi:hypothetical protein
MQQISTVNKQFEKWTSENNAFILPSSEFVLFSSCYGAEVYNKQRETSILQRAQFESFMKTCFPQVKLNFQANDLFFGAARVLS